MRRSVAFTALVLLAILPIGILAANETDFDLNIGVQYDLTDDASIIGISLEPDLSIGNFGIGLRGVVRYQVGTGFLLDDWVPDFSEDEGVIDNIQTAASLYLPVVRYVRYGYKGQPLYARLGELDAVTLGTGVFVNGYSNTILQPDFRLVGAELDLDGRLFGFPYIGFESFTNDLSLFDIIGARAYLRPLAFVNFPVISTLQIGASAVVDRDPDLYDSDSEFLVPAEQVMMYGADVMMPIISSGLFSMTAFGDLAFQGDYQDSPASAYRAGLKGKLLGLLTYNADVIFPQTDGFVPDYFSKNYDSSRYASYSNAGISTGNDYLHAGAGFDLFDENLVLDVSIQGEVDSSSGSIQILDPQMTAYFKLGEDLLPFFYLDATYTKRNLSGDSLDLFLDGVLDPLKDSIIEANVTITYSMIKTTVGYVIEFDETGEMTSSGLTAAGNIQLPFFN